MLRSMTAFGMAQISRPIGFLTVEITSYNRKFLDLKVLLDRTLARFEMFIRRVVEPRLGRGAVQVRVSLEWLAATPLKVQVNNRFAQALLEGREELQKQLQLDPKEGALDWLLVQEGVLTFAENRECDQEISSMIKEGLEAAFTPFFEMKKREGQALLHDLKERLRAIEQSLEAVDQLKGEMPLKFRERIEKILREFPFEHEERVVREVALLADKIDVSEELIRFRSHLAQLAQLLDDVEGPCGKRVEFMVQEMQREVNTLGSKAQNIAISHHVVDMKTELERIREQIANVE